MIHFSCRAFLLPKTPLEMETGSHAMPQPGATHVLSSLLWAMIRAISNNMDAGDWVLLPRTQDLDPGGHI